MGYYNLTGMCAVGIVYKTVKQNLWWNYLVVYSYYWLHCFLFIQYIDPGDAHKLEQAELVVIDEAAAIPLPLVKKLLAPCLVFMASTVNG